MFESIAGYGLADSSIALFGRVGGGIYTKVADLSGKNEYGSEEDDKRNPECTADNVGDNVGYIAGVGADLCGSFAEAWVAALEEIVLRSVPLATGYFFQTPVGNFSFCLGATLADDTNQK